MQRPLQYFVATFVRTTSNHVVPLFACAFWYTLAQCPGLALLFKSENQGGSALGAAVVFATVE
jgi:hypothetical protein